MLALCGSWLQSRIHKNDLVSTYILWDIDGTLIYNNSSAGSLYLDSIEHVTGVRPTQRVADPHGMTEGQLLAAILHVNGQDSGHLPEILSRLDELSLGQHEAGHTREPAVGTAQAIAAFASRGWVNAILTGNGPTRARFKVLAAGYCAEDFDWQHSYFGHLSPTRHHLTADARDALGENHAIIIGDTPKDGEAADTAGIPFIAVATGTYSADELRKSSALVVIDDFESGLDAVIDAVVDAIGSSSLR